MKFTSVEILEKEKCLAIAKIIHGDKFSDVELLEYLPDDVFGETLNVAYISGNYFVYDFDGRTWEVPPYFVNAIMNKFI